MSAVPLQGAPTARALDREERILALRMEILMAESWIESWSPRK